MAVVALLEARLRKLRLEEIELNVARNMVESSGLRVELGPEGHPVVTVDRALADPAWELSPAEQRAIDRRVREIAQW